MKTGHGLGIGLDIFLYCEENHIEVNSDVAVPPMCVCIIMFIFINSTLERDIYAFAMGCDRDGRSGSLRCSMDVIMSLYTTFTLLNDKWFIRRKENFHNLFFKSVKY